MGPIVLSNISLLTQSTKSRLSYHPSQTSPLVDSYFIHSLDVRTGVKYSCEHHWHNCNQKYLLHLVYKLVYRLFFEINIWPKKERQGLKQHDRLMWRVTSDMCVLTWSGRAGVWTMPTEIYQARVSNNHHHSAKYHRNCSQRIF